MYIHVLVCGYVYAWLCVNGYGCGDQKSASDPLKTGSYSIYRRFTTYTEARTRLLKSLLIQDVAFVYCDSVPVLAINGSLCIEIPY